MLSTQEAEQTAAQVAEQQARLGRLARAVYQGGGSLGNVSMLLEARSPSDFAERMVAIADRRRRRSAPLLSDLQDVQQSYGARTDDLERVRDERRRGRRAGPARPRSGDPAGRSRRTAAETRVDALVAARKAALAAAAAAQTQDDVAHAQRAGELEPAAGPAGGASPAATSAPAGSRDGATVPARPGTLGWPARGRVTSPFGMRVHPVTGVYKLHTGTDLGVPCGTPMCTRARPGVVMQAGWNSAYGWRTVDLPRRRRRRAAHHDVQPPDAPRRRGRRPGRGRPGHRHGGHHRLLDRLPPALRALRQLGPRRPGALAARRTEAARSSRVGTPAQARPGGRRSRPRCATAAARW